MHYLSTHKGLIPISLAYISMLLQQNKKPKKYSLVTNLRSTSVQ